MTRNTLAFAFVLALFSASPPAVFADALVYASEPHEKRHADVFAEDFEIPNENVSHLDDKVSVSGEDHLIINMHNGGSNGTDTVVVGYDPSGKIRTEYTAKQLAQRLRDRGYDGSKITLVICGSGSDQGTGAAFAQSLADELSVAVIGYDHDVTTTRGPSLDPWLSHPVAKAHVLGRVVWNRSEGNPITFSPAKPATPPASGSPQSGSGGGSHSSQVGGNPPLPPLPALSAPPWYRERK